MKTAGFYMLIAGLILSTITHAQPLSSVIKTQAVEMGKALVSNDMVSFKKFMDPELIASEGGEKKLSLLADSAIILFKNMGGSITKIIFDNPGEIINYQKQLQTTLPQTIFLTTPFADIEYQSTLYAVSKDGGKNWYFTDTSIFPAADLRKKIPLMSPELVIPPNSKPRFIPKNKPAS